MKIEIVKWLGWVLLIIFLCVHQCSQLKFAERIVKVKVPQIVKIFEKQKPVHTTLTKYVKSDSSNMEPTKNNFEQDEINRLLQEQEQERLEFAKATDSLQQLLYAKVTEPKVFTSVFDDQYINLEINGIVKGEVKSITPKYTIKEREIEAVVKERLRVFALKSGVEYGNNLQFNNSVFKVNMDFENKKGNSFSYGYDTNKTHWVGGKFTIFEIKR